MDVKSDAILHAYIHVDLQAISRFHLGYHIRRIRQKPTRVLVAFYYTLAFR